MKLSVVLVLFIVCVSVLQDAQSASTHELDHHRSKRTIKHIFGMFKGFMDGLFGKKKKKNNSGYGAPQQDYGAPAQNYGAPQQGYGAPKQQQKGHGGGQQQKGHGGGQQQQQGYGGGGQQQQQGYGGGGQNAQQQFQTNVAQQQFQANIAAPQAPAGNIDSYGSPQAPAIGGGGNIDSYGSPQAPPVGGNIDSYGSPQAPPVGGGGNIDSYGSPQAAPVGPQQGQYGGGVQQPRPPPPPRAQPQRPQRPPSIAPPGLADSVFKMLPAPNLATGRPNQLGGGQGQYGQQQGGFRNQQQNFVPQQPIQQAGYNNFQPQQPVQQNFQPQQPVQQNFQPQQPVQQNFQPQQQYNQPPVQQQVTQQVAVPPSNNYGSPPTGFSPQPRAPQYNAGTSITTNPFLQSSPTTPPRPAQSTNPVIQGRAPARQPLNPVNPADDTYGAPVAPVVNPVNPITDINIPEVPNVVDPQSDFTIATGQVTPGAGVDVYGSQLAPVGTSAPVPDGIITDERRPTSFDSYNNNNVEPSDPGNVPEGEIVNLTVEGEEGPLFDNLREYEFTNAQPEVSTPGAITIDLTNGVASVDLSNGVLDVTPASIDLTGTSESQPGYGAPEEPEEEEEEEIYLYNNGQDPDPVDYDQYDVDDRFPEDLATPDEAPPLPVEQPGYNDVQPQQPVRQQQETPSSYGGPEVDQDRKAEGRPPQYEDEEPEAAVDVRQPEEPVIEKQELFPEYEEPEEPAFVSVPLKIEEVGGRPGGRGQSKPQPGQPTVILAGSPEPTETPAVAAPPTLYNAPRSGRGRNHAFHDFLDLPQPPSTRRQRSKKIGDWSNRIRRKKRKQYWENRNKSKDESSQ